MTALLDRVATPVERADFDDLVTLVTQAPPWEKDRAAGVRILLRAVGESKPVAPDQILARWTWRLARTTRKLQDRRVSTEFPEAKRLTRAQVEAMDLMDELLNDPQIHLSMAFLPGDMQFLHNHQILHSRNDFENWPEPERARHLLRLWLAPQAGRPLPEIFAPRYGSVTPGERGGIVVRGTTPKVPLEAE